MSLAIPVVGAGEGSTDGSTRKLVVNQLYGGLETEIADQVSPRTARQDVQASLVLAKQRQVDNFVAPIFPWDPGTPHRSLHNCVKDGMAMVLCLPSPACMDRVGERVFDKKVDMFGDNVLCQTLAGDGWRIRHDRIKTEIMLMMG